jgi:outer membrane lipoprotein-sorting protein
VHASPFLLALLCSAPPASGEDLLQQVDRTILDAKTVRIEFEVNQETGGQSRLLATGVIRLADKNRFRTEIDYASDNSPRREMTVCDGTTAVRLTGPSPAELKVIERRTVPSWYTAAVRERLGRGGTFLATELTWQHAKDPKAERPGAELEFTTDKPALGTPEKVGDVECWVVEYELSAGGTTAKSRTWVVPKTGLPVRRRVEALGSVFTATHSAFAIDEKMDDKLFELPK